MPDLKFLIVLGLVAAIGAAVLFLPPPQRKGLV